MRLSHRLLAAAFASVVGLSLLPPASAAAVTVSLTPLRTIGFSGHAGLYGWGAATMSDGSVLIGDYWNYRVQRYATDGTLIGTAVGYMIIIGTYDAMGAQLSAIYFFFVAGTILGAHEPQSTMAVA